MTTFFSMAHAIYICNALGMAEESKSPMRQAAMPLFHGLTLRDVLSKQELVDPSLMPFIQMDESLERENYEVINSLEFEVQNAQD